MRDMESDWILVGVDGSLASAAAVEYAVEEAWRTGGMLRLVHAVPDDAALISHYPMTAPPSAGESRRIGHGMLRAAAEKAEARLGAGRVLCDLLPGERAVGLVDAARGAALVVLGDHRRSPANRVVTGSVLATVAAHAAAPVVAVPSTWQPGHDRGRLVVAVKLCDTSLGLVRRALDLAAERKAALVLLHAWELPSGYDDRIASRVDEPDVEDRARRALEGLLARAAAERQDGRPAVPVEIRVVHGQPARVLAEASAGCDLILLARRAHAFPSGHLGATGRALLRSAQCPVEVLPPATEPLDVEPLAAERPDPRPGPGTKVPATSGPTDVGRPAERS